MSDGSVTRDGLTAEQAVDRIEAALPPRPHDRRLHARGAVYDARFEPSAVIARLTSVPNLTEETRAVVRFSNGAQYAADDRARGVRGMAVKFLAGEESVHDLVAASFRVFPSRNPEGFVELVEALGSADVDGGLGERLKGKLDAAGRFAGLLTRHPESRPGLRTFVARHAPASFATCRYDGLHAFLFAGEKPQPFRYRLVPQLGEVDLDQRTAAGLAPDYLIGDLDDRLASGAVAFTLVLQLADPGDPTDDPSTPWPELRRLIPAGTMHIEARSADEDHWQRQVFDPIRLPDGITPSADPVLAFRPHAYGVSAARRLS
jgi:catalase